VQVRVLRRSERGLPTRGETQRVVGARAPDRRGRWRCLGFAGGVTMTPSTKQKRVTPRLLRARVVRRIKTWQKLVAFLPTMGMDREAGAVQHCLSDLEKDMNPNPKKAKR